MQAILIEFVVSELLKRAGSNVQRDETLPDPRFPDRRKHVLVEMQACRRRRH
jgi:hypothetical protein